MTQPNTTPPPEQGSNPPNPAPPHASQPTQQPQPRPVVVQQNDPALDARLAGVEQTLKALPERLVDFFREATSSAQQPQTPASPTPPVQQPTVQAQTQATHDTNVAKSGYKGPSRVARWYLGLGKGEPK